MKHLKIHKLLGITIGLFLFIQNATAQYKEFKLNANGDTINAISKNGLKEGKWVIKVAELRGEPGYEEEGIFTKGLREGFWRRYTLEGDLLAVENYKKGGKDGPQQYFTYVGELLREESWKGYDPDSPYDTIPVFGTGSNEILEYKIVKAEQYSIKQGEWRYYDPASGNLIRTEQWERNNLLKPGSTTASVANNAAKKKPEKTAEMLEWERKNKGKKGAIRDGRTGL
jgi:antitoxin component YwqK of YwqJK toxin-antitoxin module